MHTLVIKNAALVTRTEILENSTVICRGGTIESVLVGKAGFTGSADYEVDAGGMFLAPGFIDLHIHGSYNKLVDSGRADLEQLCRILPRYGVTGFLPTVTPFADEHEDIALLQELAKAESEGSDILGFFLEGHFLALTGAIANIPKNRTVERINRLKEASGPFRAIFGISPEVENIAALIPHMTTDGAPTFITHTMADVEQTKAAIQAGARHATHFYDVFPYPGVKEGGVRTCGAVEAIMASPEVSVDFILDGEHVHPVAAEMALVCKGHDKVCLITDANINAGLPPGTYRGIGNREVFVAYEGGPARMVESYAPDSKPGGLAGSGLTMDRAVRNAIKMLGIDLPLAAAMASANPARVLGLQERKGSIEPGFDADMVLLDLELQVHTCWKAGKQVFGR
jgi:N-acetylglucosamine-6-phosphate deacetylase